MCVHQDLNRRQSIETTEREPPLEPEQPQNDHPDPDVDVREAPPPSYHDSSSFTTLTTLHAISGLPPPYPGKPQLPPLAEEPPSAAASFPSPPANTGQPVDEPNPAAARSLPDVENPRNSLPSYQSATMSPLSPNEYRLSAAGPSLELHNENNTTVNQSQPAVSSDAAANDASVADGGGGGVAGGDAEGSGNGCDGMDGGDGD